MLFTYQILSCSTYYYYCYTWPFSQLFIPSLHCMYITRITFSPISYSIQVATYIHKRTWLLIKVALQWLWLVQCHLFYYLISLDFIWGISDIKLITQFIITGINHFIMFTKPLLFLIRIIPSVMFYTIS